MLEERFREAIFRDGRISKFEGRMHGIGRISLTPGFSRVSGAPRLVNRFSGLPPHQNR
jgi:hypothetical protein